jgi:hypothetical protein
MRIPVAVDPAGPALIDSGAQGPPEPARAPLTRPRAFLQLVPRRLTKPPEVRAEGLDLSIELLIRAGDGSGGRATRAGEAG